MMNYLRNSQGTLVAKFTPSLTKQFLDNLEGSWKLKKFVDGTSMIVFIISENRVIRASGGLTIYLWEGDYICDTL